MPITEGTQPAVVTFTGTWTSPGQTTASFTPEAGALLVALVAADGTGAGPTDTITDSLGGSWTLLRRENTGAGTMDGVASVWCRDSPGTSLTVTVTGTGGTSTGGQLVVRTLLGAKAAAQQTGATNGVEGDPTTQQVSVAAGTGNRIYGAAFNFSNSTVMTPLANTSVINQFSDTTNGDTWEAFKSSGDTAGTATYGYSTSTSGMTCAVEILAASAAGGGLPFLPGRTWERRFYHRQILPTAVAIAAGGDFTADASTTVTETDTVSAVVGEIGAVTATVTAGLTVTAIVGVVGGVTATVTAGGTVSATTGAVGAVSATVTCGSTVTAVVGAIGAVNVTVTCGSTVTASTVSGLIGTVNTTVTTGSTVTAVVGAVGAVNTTVTAGWTTTAVVAHFGAINVTVTAGSTVTAVVARFGAVTGTVTTSSTVVPFLFGAVIDVNGRVVTTQTAAAVVDVTSAPISQAGVDQTAISIAGVSSAAGGAASVTPTSDGRAEVG